MSIRETYNDTTVAAILQERPSIVPSLLRELHDSKDNPRRWVFVETIGRLANDPAQGELWHTLAENGLKRALMGILREEVLCGYTSSELTEQYRHDAHMQGYIAHCLLLLALYLSYLEVKPLVEPDRTLGDPEQSDAPELLQWLPSFWDTLWWLRRIIRVKPCEKSYCLSERLGDLGILNWQLKGKVSRKPPNFHSSHLAHVMFFTFVHSTSLSAKDHSRSVCVGLLNLAGQVIKGDVNLFFSTVLATPEDARRAMDAFQQDLGQRSKRSGDVKPTIDLLGSWMTYSRHINDSWPTYHETNEIINSLIMAYERDTCAGYMPLVVVSISTAQWCLFIISRLLEYRPMKGVLSLSPRNAYMLLSIILDCIRQASEMIIITRGKAFTQVSEETRARSSAPLAFQADLVLSSLDVAAAILRQREEEAKELYHVHVRLRPRWSSALQSLERADATTPSGLRDPRLIKAMRAVTLELGWTRQFNEDIVHHPVRAKTLDELRSQGCHNWYCLCFGRRPRHQLRVCTGCLQEAYCSIRCQNRAWKDGHKRICPGAAAAAAKAAARRAQVSEEEGRVSIRRLNLQEDASD